MKQLFVTLSLFICHFSVISQSTRNVVVEHFSNTRCSICASKNPAFYQILAGYPQVIHLSIHPSAPYSNCFFNQQNKTENDDRTKYYNAYGSTPKVAINGKLLPASGPLITNETLDTILNQTSPIQVTIANQLTAPDEVLITVIIKTTGVLPVADARLFVAAAEDTVNYNATNGETLHHDVFRKALSNVVGDSITLPATGDSLVLQFNYKTTIYYKIPQLFAVAFIQRADTKEILNAGRSDKLNVAIPTGIQYFSEDGFAIYPNPVTDNLSITGLIKDNTRLEILDVSGRVVLQAALNSNHYLNVSELTKGLYFLRAEGKVKRFIKE